MSRTHFAISAAIAAILVAFSGCSTFLHVTGNEAPQAIGTGLEGIERLVQDAEFAESKGDPSQAIRLLVKACEIDPDRHDLTHRLAILYDRQGDHREADVAYNQAIENLPADAEVRNDYGIFKLNRDQIVEAESLFRQALSVDPELDRASINLARSLVLQGRTDESLALFIPIIGTAAAQSNIGVLLMRQGKYRDARQHFSKALKIDAQLEPAKSLLAELERQ